MNGVVPNADRLTIRWTIGHVRPRGFELLRLSIACAHRLFGPSARFLVYVNTIPVEDAQRLTGEIPAAVEWRTARREELPALVLPYLDPACMEGMGWKLAPPRVDPDRFELALDNDVILWALPEGMRDWLSSEEGALFAEDAGRYLGSFDALCPPGNFNAGIRGLAPGVDIEAAMHWALESASALAGKPLQLIEEIEEQGLQAAAVFHLNPTRLVCTGEVTICSPFWPRSPEPGPCGAHFVGLNAHHIPWNYYDRPADDWLEDHWQRHRPALYERAGLRMP